MRERTEEDIADAAAYPFDEEAEMKSLGALGPHGEEGYTTLERRYVPYGFKIANGTLGPYRG